jgi:hypothetical protein
MSTDGLTKRTLASNSANTRRNRSIAWICTAVAIGTCAAIPFKPETVVLAVIAIAFAAGMHVFCACYVTLLELEGGTLIVHTAALGAPTHRIAVTRITRKEFTAYGRMGTFASAEQPMIKLYVEGRRLPFVIDAGIEVLDLPTIKSL